MFFVTTPARQSVAVSPALRSLDRSLERFLTQGLVAPSLNAQIEQDEKAFTLSLDIPGLAKEHLNLEIEGQSVRISSKEGAPRQVKAAYELSQEIDVAASSAKLENGVLSLHLAKVVPVSRTTQLAIA
jgi:HSP20 family protein